MNYTVKHHPVTCPAFKTGQYFTLSFRSSALVSVEQFSNSLYRTMLRLRQLGCFWDDDDDDALEHWHCLFGTSHRHYIWPRETGNDSRELSIINSACSFWYQLDAHVYIALRYLESAMLYMHMLQYHHSHHCSYQLFVNFSSSHLKHPT